MNADERRSDLLRLGFMRSFIGFVFLSLVCVANAQPPGSDPIFGMEFDAKTIHFEQAPASIAQHCEGLKELKRKPFWLFAHATFEGTEYFILSNHTTEVTGVGL